MRERKSVLRVSREKGERLPLCRLLRAPATLHLRAFQCRRMRHQDSPVWSFHVPLREGLEVLEVRDQGRGGDIKGMEIPDGDSGWRFRVP